MVDNCQQCQYPLVKGSRFCTNCGFTLTTEKTVSSNTLNIILGALLSFVISTAICLTGLYLILAGITVRYSPNHDNELLIAATTVIVFLLHLFIVPMMLSSRNYHNVRRGYNWGNAIFISLALTGLAILYSIIF